MTLVTSKEMPWSCTESAQSNMTLVISIEMPWSVTKSAQSNMANSLS